LIVHDDPFHNLLKTGLEERRRWIDPGAGAGAGIPPVGVVSSPKNKPGPQTGRYKKISCPDCGELRTESNMSRHRKSHNKKK